MAHRISALLFFLALLPASVVRAQSRPDAHVRAGDRYFKQLAYARAIDEYVSATEKGALNEHVTRRLAESYMRVGNTEQAERWYAMAVKYLNRDPRDVYNYAQVLRSNAKYELAEEWMDRYLALSAPDGPVRRSNITEYARKFTLDTDRFTVRPVSVNSLGTDMAPAWAGDGRLLFASTRGDGVAVKRTSAWNGESFLDLYSAHVTSEGDLKDVQLVKGDANSAMHDGPAVVAVNGARDLWLTRNSAQRSRTGISRLGIYHLRWNGIEWKGVEPFLYNNPECNVGHAALSPDGKRMYFMSDMPGGFGGADLYMCRDMGGHWGEPENLGEQVNTSGNEVFPFVGADGTLYFASNGHPGLGGLDLFASPQGQKGMHQVVINLGAPVNSSKDDFAFIIDAQERSGFFTSARNGRDDLYSFVMHRPLEQRYMCTGTVFDDEYETPVIELEVRLLDNAGNLVATAMTDARGTYTFAVEKDREYRVKASMKGRFDAEQYLSTDGADQRQIMVRDLHLVPDAGVWLRGVARYKDRPGSIPEMIVSLVNLSSFSTETRTTGDAGDFNFRLQPNEKYEVLLEKPGYFSMSVPVTTAGMRQGVIDLNQARELAFEPVQVGKGVRLKYVRWAQGSVQLDPVAKAELEALAERLLVNRDLNVEIGVHGDARGDVAAELKLSQKRADAIVDFLRTKGVPKERLTGKGYGATRLLNQCAPGVQCTEEEHAENRRSEYTITSIRE